MNQAGQNMQPLMDYGSRVSKLSREYYLGEHVMEMAKEDLSALVFLRMVAMNKPFVVRGYDLELSKKWTNGYLQKKMDGQEITVAVTPDGRADAIGTVVDGDGWRKGFFLPHETRMDFSHALYEIKSYQVFADRSQMKQPRRPETIIYAQAQNNCMISEYARLLEDVPTEIPWASEGLGASPDAVNFWMGSKLSSTSLHKDNYENLYLVVRGSKTFTLYPPTDCFMFITSDYPIYRYSKDMKLLPENHSVPWCEEEPLRNDVKPLVVTVNSGDLLFLPALFYHRVEQNVDDGGLCIAVNYWYDMVFDQRVCWTDAASPSYHLV